MQRGDMMFGIIWAALFGVLFVAMLIWYRLKLRILGFKGRTDAIVMKISEFTRQYSKNKKQTFYKFTAEYYAGEKTYIIRRTIPKKQELREGNRLDIVYDEKNPRRCELAENIAAPGAVRKQWRLVPIFAFKIGRAHV